MPHSPGQRREEEETRTSGGKERSSPSRFILLNSLLNKVAKSSMLSHCGMINFFILDKSNVGSSGFATRFENMLQGDHGMPTGELTLLNTLSVEEAQTALHKNFYSFVSTSQYKRRLAMSYHVEQAKLSW